MFESKRIGKALLILAVMLALAMFFAACTSFHWITPVPFPETPVPAAETAVADPEQVTPEPSVVTATVNLTTEVAAETPGVEPAVEQIAADSLPSPLTHALKRHEDCHDCHAVDSRREPAPADHINLSKDVCLYCHTPEEGDAAIPPLPDPVTTEFCLSCHGPFEELMARTEGYLTKEGEEINPHMYIPHDRNDIRPCVKCHDPHPLPVVAQEEIPHASVEYCYTACHHEENFTPCDECHADDEE